MSTTSYSETSSYIRCRRNHWYSYGRSLERNETSDSLGMGKALHAALETFYRHFIGKPAATDWDMSEGSEMWTAIEDALTVFHGFDIDVPNRQDLRESLKLYFKDEPFVQQGWTVVAVEAEYVLEYSSEPERRLPVVIDLILLDPQGKLVVVDHKTGYEFLASGSDEEYLQPQIPLYIAVLRALGYKAAYGIYNQFRTRKIKNPSIDQLLRIVDVSPTTQRVQRTLMEQTLVADEIDYLKEELTLEQWDMAAVRTSNKMVCQSCPFKELCISDLMGSNSDLVIATQYKPREKRDKVWITSIPIGTNKKEISA